jgi:hypothetical protein
MKPEETQVHAFDELSMREQARLSQYNVPINWIYQYTGGNPHLANVIAWHINQWTAGQKPNPAWLKEYQEAFTPILRTYEENILERVPEGLRDPLYAIAPLRFYRLEAMRYMLSNSQQAEIQPDSYYLKILHELDQKTEIVWWSHPHRSYVTDEIIRRVINRRQQLEDREKFIEWHQHAHAMYREWIEKYKEASEDFIVEAWFHLANIYLATENEAELLTKVEELIRFAKENLSPDRLLVLRKSLEEDNGDKEMLELIPDNLCQMIRKQLV